MRLNLVVLVLLLAILGGCKVNSKVNKPVVGNVDISKPAVENVNVKKSNVMKTDYEIKVGESFQFELASNPTTGYAWKWSNQESIQNVEKVDSKYTATDNPNGMVGSGGTETWKFKGLKSGSETLKLEYKRSWESGPAAEVKSINVTVK